MSASKTSLFEEESIAIIEAEVRANAPPSPCRPACAPLLTPPPLPQLAPPPLAPWQLLSGVYSARSGHGLLRLYHFFPSRLNPAFVEVLFLRALMALPEPDFVQALSLLPEAARTPVIPLLGELEHLLQKAQFTEFWERAQDPLVAALLARTALAQPFADAVRAFVASVLLRTYRRISLADLGRCLGLDGAQARQWAGQRGWAIAEDAKAGPVCELPASADNTPRPVKKVGEDGLGLKFSEVSAVLGRL
jgi:hypothetical protein